MLERMAALLRMKPPVLGDDGYLFASGSTVPTDGDTGYQTGCFFQHTDGGADTAVYINIGTALSCDFNAVEALTVTQAGLLGATAGTVTASKAVIVDANKDAAALRTLGVVNLDAGSSGVAGTTDVFPATASKGKFTLSCDDQDGDTAVGFKPAAMGQATVVSIPDPGAATANVMLTDQGNDGAPITASSAELNVLDGVTAGASLASKGLVLDASGHLASGPVILDDMVAGTGISTGTNTICEHRVTKVGGLFKTEILIDLTGLNEGGTAGDVIGKDGGTANCHIGQITAAKNGAIIAGRVTCFETPAGGNTDVDIWGSVVEATLAQDTAITDATDESQLINHGAWAAEEVDHLSALPAADGYLYLACGASTDADYTAGILLIELWGK